MSALTRAKVLQQLMLYTEAKPFSLTSFVFKRLSLNREGHKIKAEEKAILDRLATVQREMAEPGEYDNDEYRSKCRAFDHCWQATQEYYIQHHAPGILVTAATATTPILRSYRPTHIIIDEASQVTEYNTVPVLVVDIRGLNQIIESIAARLERRGEERIPRMSKQDADRKEKMEKHIYQYKATGQGPDSRKILIRMNNPGEEYKMEVGGRGGRLLRIIGWKEVVRFFSRCQKVVLVRDELQRSPFQLNTRSEFRNTVERSLMTRLRSTGVPLTKLQTQYRMHKDIAATVSVLFYGSSLINDPSVESKPEYKHWRDFHQRVMPNRGKRHSIFIHVPLSTLYRRKKNQSPMNPNNLCVIKNLVDSLKAVEATEIAILTPYKGQLRLHRKIQNPDITLASVDSAQGKEYDFVILDLVTPGG
ncbi:AAA domain-containing protein [Usnea florida]